MNRDEFIRRVAAAILIGQRKSGDPSDPSSATAYATHVTDKLPGLSRSSSEPVERVENRHSDAQQPG